MKFGGGDFDVKTEGGDITRDSGGDSSDNGAADDIENEGGDSCGDVDDRTVLLAFVMLLLIMLLLMMMMIRTMYMQKPQNLYS